MFRLVLSATACGLVLLVSSTAAAGGGDMANDNPNPNGAAADTALVGDNGNGGKVNDNPSPNGEAAAASAGLKRHQGTAGASRTVLARRHAGGRGGYGPRHR